MNFERIRFWVGLLMAFDALIVMATSRYWQRKLPGIRILALARIEAAAALIILALHILRV